MRFRGRAKSSDITTPPGTVARDISEGEADGGRSKTIITEREILSSRQDPVNPVSNVPCLQPPPGGFQHGDRKIYSDNKSVARDYPSEISRQKPRPGSHVKYPFIALLSGVVYNIGSPSPVLSEG